MSDAGPDEAGAEQFIAFNARAYFARRLGLYRIYLTPSEAFFIQILVREHLRSERVLMHSMIHLMGPVAVLFLPVQLWLNARDERQALERATHWDGRPLDELLTRRGNNFRVTPEDFQNARLDPPGWGSRRASGGRWSFHLPKQGKLHLQFLSEEDVHTALAILPAWLGPRLRVDLEWDADKGRFVKRRPERAATE